MADAARHIPDGRIARELERIGGPGNLHRAAAIWDRLGETDLAAAVRQRMQAEEEARKHD